jgi:hypothetical protein
MGWQSWDRISYSGWLKMLPFPPGTDAPSSPAPTILITRIAASPPATTNLLPSGEKSEVKTPRDNPTTVPTT